MVKTYRQTFNNFADFFSAANAKIADSDSDRYSRNGKASWTGSASYSHSKSLAINGVPEIEARIARLSETLEYLAGECRDSMRLEYDVFGGSVDVELYLSGENECMTRFACEPQQQKIISILVNGSAGCTVENDVIERKGASVLALIDLLERAGYRVELSVQFCCKSSDTNDVCCTMIGLKQAGDALDISRLCYTLAHPSMFRRTIFSFWETLSDLRANFGFNHRGNYGLVVDGDAVADLFVSRKEIYYFESDDSAKAWIQSALQTLGVKQSAE